MIPPTPPKVEYIIAFHSTKTFIHIIVHAAAVMPTDWIMYEKSRATGGAMPKARVMTGNAIAAPPSLVAPANIDPKIIVMDIYQRGISSVPAVPVKSLKPGFPREAAVHIHAHQTI